MAPQQFITMANQCQSVLDEDVLNERGQQVGFAKRERLLTPLRLGLSVVASMATQQVQTLADLHRQFHALWALESDDNAFYTPRLKSTAPEFFRTSLCHIMRQRTMKVLGFEAGQAFSAFHRLLLQDGSAFALPEALAACRRDNAMANYKALRLVRSRPFAPEKPHERIRERSG